ncbi:hypothetical protein BTO16_12830 [Polaribacter glomeratus]|uniref:Uncharacterized protein n=2 Tax=Polaribacter glomeratus TaxID=102 RepID=A0A2S7WGL9_9FLAO|nr:hypothetical protein BTO16_12830 [Polaribacter glomeratus]
MSLLFFNCEKEPNQLDENITIKSSNNIIVEEFSINENNYQPKFNNLLNKLTSKVSKNDLKKNNLPSFNIDSSKVKKVTLNGKTTYTLFIESENSEVDSFENLILEIDSLDIPKAYMVKYFPENKITYYEEHDSYTFSGTKEVTEIDFNSKFLLKKSSLKTEVICGYEVWCFYSYAHLAGTSCKNVELQYVCKVTSGGSGQGNPGSNSGRPSSGGGSSSSGNSSSSESAFNTAINFSPEKYTINNFFNSLTTEQKSFLETPLDGTINYSKQIISNFLGQNYIPLSEDINSGKITDEAYNFIIKAIDILRNATNTNTLSTDFENQSFTKLVGNILNAKNQNIFTDFNSLFNSLEFNNSLSNNDRNLISRKILEIYTISNQYDLSSLNDISQLSIFDQQTITQNSLFINFLPNFASLGIQLPQTAEEWQEFGEILVEVMYEIIPDLIPGIAELNSLKNSISAFNSGNYTDGTTELAFALIGVFPAGKLMKALAKFAKLAKKTAKIFKTYLKLFKINKSLARGYKAVISNSNDMYHIFGNVGHKLNNLVTKAGGEKEALLKAYEKVNDLNLGNTLSNDEFKIFTGLNILGEVNVTIYLYKNLDGSLIKISNMFIP